jgi:hypothetical protein
MLNVYHVICPFHLYVRGLSSNSLNVFGKRSGYMEGRKINFSRKL